MFNIGCGRQITINQLVDMINEIIGVDIKPIYSDTRPGDVKHSLSDISKAKSFGYEPYSNFKEELKETIEWFKQKI